MVILNCSRELLLSLYKTVTAYYLRNDALLSAAVNNALDRRWKR